MTDIAERLIRIPLESVSGHMLGEAADEICNLRKERDAYYQSLLDTIDLGTETNLRAINAEAERDALRAELEVSEAAGKTKTLMIVDLRAALRKAVEAMEPFRAYCDADDERIRLLEIRNAELKRQKDKGIFPERIRDEDAAWNAAEKVMWSTLKDAKSNASALRAVLSEIKPLVGEG